MAWIKAEDTLPDKPEVIRMATELGLDQDAVVGKLIRIWIWADKNTISGNAIPVTSSFLDRLTAFPGFADAMRKVAWLEGREGSLSFPRFDRHNGQTAKLRAETNRRVSKCRAAKADQSSEVTPHGNENVTQSPLQKPLPDKRRERVFTSKEVNTPLNPPQGEIASELVGGRKRKPLATSTANCSAAITGVEVDGNLLLYDDDPLVWQAAFVSWWNGLPGVVKRSVNTLDTSLQRTLIERFHEGDWNWKLTEPHFPLWVPSDWQPTLNWFLEPGSVSKILGGVYAQRTAKTGLFENSRKDPARIRTGKTSAAIKAAMAAASAASGGGGNNHGLPSINCEIDSRLYQQE